MVRSRRPWHSPFRASHATFLSACRLQVVDECLGCCNVIFCVFAFLVTSCTCVLLQDNNNRQDYKLKVGLPVGTTLDAWTEATAETLRKQVGERPRRTALRGGGGHGLAVRSGRHVVGGRGRRSIGPLTALACACNLYSTTHGYVPSTGS